MTGSGSAIFALFESKDERERARKVLEGDRVFRGLPCDAGEAGEPAELPAAVAAPVGGASWSRTIDLWPPRSRYAR